MFYLHCGDLTDSVNLVRIIQEVQPDEIYNLGAMSHVKVSFETPEYTANADGVRTIEQSNNQTVEQSNNQTLNFKPSNLKPDTGIE